MGCWIRDCAPCPEALSCATAWNIDGKIYVFGGRDSLQKCSNKLYVYDCASDNWQCLGETPLQKRVYPISAVSGNAVYVGLGYNGSGIYTEGSYLCDFWRYEPASDHWERLADYPDPNCNSAIAFAYDGNIYAGFGFQKGFTKDIHQYDPLAGKWDTVEQDYRSCDPPRMTASVAATSDGRCFIGTGFRNGSHNFWGEFMPESGKWKKCASVPGKGRHNVACSANDTGIWLFGGWHYGDPEGSGRYYSNILRYIPDTDKWSRVGVLPCGEAMNMVAATVDGNVYFGLGETPEEKPLNNFYCIEK